MIAAPVAGALIFSAAPVAAAPTAPAATVVAAKSAAADPFSVFDVKLTATKKAKRGGKIRYTITAVNTGPHEATAGTWFVGGLFPKGVDLRKITYRTSVDDTACELIKRELFCVLPATVKKGESIAMVFDGRLTKKASGSQKAVLGVVSYNVETGMENLSKEELDRLGVPGFGFVKQATTKVVR
ncbi:hypothetical protein ACFXJ8_24205 [Nonomuraea sp. NPDC059194]|uniref:hypothetical protein n=1 Tax=Nonomuraea sp. NPDC059194 TaxID=3346764 RepID=UPI0036BA9F4A